MELQILDNSFKSSSEMRAFTFKILAKVLCQSVQLELKHHQPLKVNHLHVCSQRGVGITIPYCFHQCNAQTIVYEVLCCAALCWELCQLFFCVCDTMPLETQFTNPIYVFLFPCVEYRAFIKMNEEKQIMEIYISCVQVII